MFATIGAQDTNVFYEPILAHYRFQSQLGVSVQDANRVGAQDSKNAVSGNQRPAAAIISAVIINKSSV
jgi:hypothetical protein